MIKILVFYGGILIALVATIILWLFRRPELKVCLLCDETTKTIQCTFRTVRSRRPIRLTSIWIPVEYAQALGASPPAKYKEMPQRLFPVWLYDNAKREVIVWSGHREVSREQPLELSIPAKHPHAVSGTLRFCYEFRGVAGVLMGFGALHVPIKSTETKQTE